LPIPDWLRQRVLRRDHGACRYCGKTDGPFHLDHVLPVAHGGRTNLRNLVTACSTCNLRKGTQHWVPTPLPRRK
jgi:5-methylcytosine-specific restriction endonuclease McrA